MTVRSSAVPPEGSDRSRIVRLNVIALAASMLVSLGFVAAILWVCEPKAFIRGMVAALVLPPLLVGPVLYYASMELLKLWKANRDLEVFAHKDALTQLWNRGAFTAKVDKHLTDMADLSSSRGALLIVDADHFKSVNDRWGHQAGDHALRRIASAMVTALHRDDVIGRLGGEEFGVFLYGSSPAAARGVAEKMRAAVEAIELRSEDGEPIPLTISVGGVHFREALTFSALYQRADRNLYAAKANGRNRVEFENLAAESCNSLAA